MKGEMAQEPVAEPESGNHLVQAKEGIKKPELRKALKGRTGPYWLAPKEDFSETILEEKEQAQF